MKMKQFNSIMAIVASVLLMSALLISINSFAAEFDKKSAVAKYRESQQIQDKFVNGMGNAQAIEQAETVIDYLNGLNVFQSIDTLTKLALSHSMMSGSNVSAIIIYTWMELAISDVLYLCKDSPAALKDGKAVVVRCRVLKNQAYSNLNLRWEKRTAKMESRIIKYFKDTPTRAIVYNKKIRNTIYAKK